jgi:[ribosomal protein S5]-alanine N-acetyltransferase
MELTTRCCVVRDYRPSDAASLAAHGNNRKIWLNLRDRFPHPFREADAAEYIAAVLARPVPTSFAIAVADEAVGGISLRRGEDIERLTAELGYWLGEAFWGRGIVTDAIAAVTDWGFRELDLVRIFAVPFVENEPSQRVLAKTGYEREGLLRSSAIKDGRILDQYMYARVAPSSLR